MFTNSPGPTSISQTRPFDGRATVASDTEPDARLLLRNLIVDVLDLRPHSGELRVELALFHLEFGFALNRAWGIVVAVADEHAVGDRVMFDFRLLETLLSRGFGGVRGVPFVLDPIAFGSRNKARLLQMVAALLGGCRLRRFRARCLKLRGLPREPRIDQPERRHRVFFGLKIEVSSAACVNLDCRPSVSLATPSVFRSRRSSSRRLRSA